MSEPKPYPPTSTERKAFYEGLNKHDYEKQMGKTGGQTKLRDNGCCDLHRLSRPPSGETLQVWAKAIGENSI